MARPTWYEHANLRLGGRLDSILEEYRRDGLSHDLISRRLDDDHGIEVSRETIRRWLMGLTPEPENAA